MSPFDPLLWRLVGRLAAHITKFSRHARDIDLATHSIDATRRLLDQLLTATERGWHLAAENLGWQLRNCLSECQTRISAGLQVLSSGAFWQPPPTQRLIYDELVAVRAEFAEFSFDLPDETVAVYTDEITLEGIDLGRFEIRLQGRELGGTPYIIIPESPHYPSSRSDVPHPHVLGERLCEGDASAPLAHALRTGRFSDYFQIIQQTLSSYNSESPYVSLSAWYGVNCHACGFGISSADDLLLIEDFVLVRQHCSVITVAFEDEAVAEFFDRQIDRKLRPEQFGRVWIHTHPGDSAQPSSVDEETFARVFGRSDWAVMAIIACGGDTFARLQFPAGPGGSMNLPFAVDYRRPFTGSDHETWASEYLANVQPVPDLIFSESSCLSMPSHAGDSSRTYSPLELAAWPEW